MFLVGPNPISICDVVFFSFSFCSEPGRPIVPYLACKSQTLSSIGPHRVE